MSNIIILIIGVSIIGVLTIMGAAAVFFFRKKFSEKANKIFLGFASGVMIAASVWSLLIPAIEYSNEQGVNGLIPAGAGFVIGGLIMMAIDKLVPHYHYEIKKQEGPKTKLTTGTKLFLAMLIHNIPEGLAVGFAFGAALLLTDDPNNNSLFLSALALAIGIGIQNLPEGAAVSLPLKKETGSTKKAFLMGSITGIVEPIAAVIGIFLAYNSFGYIMLPWLLALAAGMMIYVTVEELIPQAHLGEHSHYGTWGVLLGFVVMMLLDVALG
jgi:zinc transporter, ZIP family